MLSVLFARCVFMSWAEAVLAVFKAFESSRKTSTRDTKIVMETVPRIFTPVLS